jgi:hypothetical protein
VLFASVLSAAAVSSLFLDTETKGRPLLDRISEIGSNKELAEVDPTALREGRRLKKTSFVKTPSGSFALHEGRRLKKTRVAFEARWSAARLPS